MVPQVEDDLIDQMLEIKPMEKGSNHVFICIMKMIGCHGIEGNQKHTGHMFNWITIFEHELLRKFLARLEPCAGNCRSWMKGTWGVPKDLQGSEWRRKDDSGYDGNGQRTRTPWTVLILRGKDVMSLLYTPRKFGFLNVWCTHSSGEEVKAKAPPEEKW